MTRINIDAKHPGLSEAAMLELDACDPQPSPPAASDCTHAGQGVLSDNGVVAMGKRLNRFESAASNRPWVVARPRFWERAFPMAGLVRGQGGVLTFGPTYLASLCCSLAFYSTFFASSLLSRSGLGLPQPACQPASLPAQHRPLRLAVVC